MQYKHRLALCRHSREDEPKLTLRLTLDAETERVSTVSQAEEDISFTFKYRLERLDHRLVTSWFNAKRSGRSYFWCDQPAPSPGTPLTARSFGWFSLTVISKLAKCLFDFSSAVSGVSISFPSAIPQRTSLNLESPIRSHRDNSVDVSR